MILIGLCGSSGIGKTAFCQKIVEIAKENRGANLAGFYCPAVFLEGVKTGIDCVRLPDQERRRFGSLAQKNSEHIIGKWEFSPETITWATEPLEEAEAYSLLIVDEIGPLEINYGQGWAYMLDFLSISKAKIALVTFRPSCMNYFKREFPSITIFNLADKDNQETVLKMIKSKMGAEN